MIDIISGILLTSILFYFFIIVISIFGSIFFNFIKKKSQKEWKESFTEKFFLSFGIGLSIYFPISIFLNLFGLINFYSSYLPFIIIDMMYLFFESKKKGVSIKRIYCSIKLNLKKRSNVIFLFTYVITIIIQLNLQLSVITSRLSLLSIDPFINFGETSQLLNNNFSFETYYPKGFIFFCASCLSLSISPTFNMRYAFFKLAPIPFFSFFILVVFLLVRKIFKKNYFVLYTSLMILISVFLNLRLLYFLSSNVAVLLTIITLFILTNKRLPFYLISFFFVSIYYINPLVQLFYLIVISIFSLMKLLTYFYLKSNLKNLIRMGIITITFTIILLIPYVIYIYFTGSSLYNVINSYLYSLSLEKLIFISSSINFSIIIEIILKFLTSWIPADTPIYMQNYFLNNQLVYSIFFILAILSLFIRSRKKELKKYNNLILFGKSSIILLLIFFYLPLIGINFILSAFPLWMFLRLIEIFYVPIIIMECFYFSIILKKIDKFIKNFRPSIKKYKLLYNLKKILLVFLITSSISTYILTYNTKMYIIKGNYLFRDSEIEPIFFINDNINLNSQMLVYNNTDLTAKNAIYNLLYDYEYKIWDFSTMSYNFTKAYVQENRIEFILINKIIINSSYLNPFLLDNNSLVTLFENDIIILFEVS